MKRILTFILAAALLGCLALPVAAETTYASGETVKLGGMKFKVPEGQTAKEMEDGSIEMILSDYSGFQIWAADISEYRSEFMRQYLLQSQRKEKFEEWFADESKEPYSIQYQIQKETIEFKIDSGVPGSALGAASVFLHGDYIYTILYVNCGPNSSFTDDEMVLFESFLKSIKF